MVNVGDGVVVRSVSRGYLVLFFGIIYVYRKVLILVIFKVFWVLELDIWVVVVLILDL